MGGKVFYKVLYRDAPPRVPTPRYPFVYHFDSREKVPGQCNLHQVGHSHLISNEGVESLFYKKFNHEISINFANFLLEVIHSTISSLADTNLWG